MTAVTPMLGIESNQVRAWPSASAQAWVEEFLKEVVGDRAVVAVIGVGSSVRETLPPADVDLIVVFQGTRPPYRRHPIDVDIRYFDHAALDSLIAGGHDYLVWAVTFGRVLYQRGRAWDHLLRRWRGVVPLPDPGESELRAARARAHLRELSTAGDQDAAREMRVTELTHRARAKLLRAGLMPASRPELPDQLLSVGEFGLAEELREARAGVA